MAKRGRKKTAHPSDATMRKRKQRSRAKAGLAPRRPGPRLSPMEFVFLFAVHCQAEICAPDCSQSTLGRSSVHGSTTRFFDTMTEQCAYLQIYTNAWTVCRDNTFVIAQLEPRSMQPSASSPEVDDQNKNSLGKYTEQSCAHQTLERTIVQSANTRREALDASRRDQQDPQASC